MMILAIPAMWRGGWCVSVMPFCRDGRPRPSTLRTVLEAHSSGGSAPLPRAGGMLLRKIDDPTTGADCGFGVLMDAQREIEGCLKSVKDRQREQKAKQAKQVQQATQRGPSPRSRQAEQAPADLEAFRNLPVEPTPEELQERSAFLRRNS